MIDPVTGEVFPGAMILHAICQVPLELADRLSRHDPDRHLINGAPIIYAVQVAAQSISAFSTAAFDHRHAAAAPCASSATTAGQPFQCMMFSNLCRPLQQHRAGPTQVQMSLANNTTFIAPQLPPMEQLGT